MKKRIFTIFLIMILAVTNLSVCYAEPLKTGMEGLLDIDLENYENYLNANDFSGGKNWTDEVNAVDAAEDTPAGIIAVIISFLTWLPKQLVNVLLQMIKVIVPMMDVIIFNGEGQVSIWGSFCQLSYFDPEPGIGMAGHMVGFVSAFYQVFRYIALIGFVVAIAVIAVKMILASIGKQKQQYKEGLKNWLVGLMLLVVGHWIMIYSIYFSDYLVSLIYKIKEAIIRNSENSLVTAFSDAVGASAATAWGPILFIIWSIAALIAIIIFVAMNLKIFKVYLERVIVVGVLIMIFPLVTIFYAFEKSGIKKGSTFESWLRTFIDQVFIQPVHALTLVCVIIALNAVSSTLIMGVPIIGMIVVLMVLNVMFTIENIIKRVFAINGAGLGQPINPAAPAAAALGVLAPVGRHGFNAGAKKFAELRGNGVKKGAALREAWKTGRGAAGRYAVTGKNRGRFLNTMLGAAGVKLPNEVFGKEHMTVKEQKDAEKLMLQAGGTADLTSMSGNKLWESTRNLMNTSDPDIVAEAFRKLPGFNQHKLREAMLFGRGTDEDILNARKFALMLADPTADVADLDGPELDYYTNNDDDDINGDLNKGYKLTAGNIPKNVGLARKIYARKHADKADAHMRSVGLTEDKIQAIESGGPNVTDNDVLAYELMLRKFEGSKADVEACKDSTGNWDKEIIHNIDMSDKKMAQTCREAREVQFGQNGSIVTPKPEVITMRKVFEANKPTEAYKIKRSCNLTDVQIEAIELGNTSYIDENNVTQNITNDQLLSYKVMVDRMGSGRSMDEYQDSSGHLSETIYQGVSMETSQRFNNATDLTTRVADVINVANDREMARETLASFRSADESKFYKAIGDMGVASNDIISFIETGSIRNNSNCDAAAILGILDNLVRTK